MLVLLTCLVNNQDILKQSIVCTDINSRIKTGLKGDLSDTKDANNSESKQLLLLTASASQLFSPGEIGSTVGTVSSLCSDSVFGSAPQRPYCALLLKSVQVLIQNSTCTARLSNLDIEAVFKLWVSLSSQPFSGTRWDSLEMRLLQRLETLMAGFIIDSEVYCLQTATLMRCIQEKSKTIVVELACKSLTCDELDTSSKDPDRSRSSFLVSLLVYDASIFSSDIIKCLRTSSNASGGEFRLRDEVMAVAVREIHPEA